MKSQQEAGEWTRGKISGGIFGDDTIKARLHGSIIIGSSSLNFNNLNKDMSLEFSVLKEEIQEKKLDILLNNKFSEWQEMHTSKIEDFEVVPPEQEITPEKITGE